MRIGVLDVVLDVDVEVIGEEEGVERANPLEMKEA